MDVSAAPLIRGANFFCRLAPLRPNSAPSAPSKRNVLRKGAESSIVFPKVPSRRCSSTARCGGSGILQIAARVRRLSRRRNTLREKILPSTVEQVRRVPETLNTVPHLELSEDADVVVEDFRKYTDADSKNEVVEDVLSESGKLPKKKSALRDKLENWVDQYKLDSEFWGVGTSPIFMIYQDSDKKIVCVTVNEDEIIKRSRTRAFSQEEAEQTTDVNSKIFRAKLIARMIESGEYALPRNSSVVRFVVDGKKSFFEELRSISLQGQPFPKRFPRVAFTFLCGCCILWASMKLFVQNEKVALSREEAEMLRRKIKLRIEREEMEKGSVKVLDDLPELSVASRPQLDRNELMKSIVQAKGSTEKYFTTDSFSYLNVKTREFDDKVKEIREMARKIREQEQKVDSETETSKRPEIDSIVWPKNKLNVTSKNIDLETEAKGEASSTDITSSINSPMLEKVDIKFHVKNREMFGKNSAENLNRTTYQEPLNSVQDNENSIIDEVDQHEMGSTRCSGGAQSIDVNIKNIINCDAVSSGNVLINGGKLGENELQNPIVEERINSSNSSEVSKFKPKIITSVEEAKEFLARKHGMLFDTVRPDPDLAKHQSAGVNASNHLDDDKVTDSISLKNTEGMFVVDTQVENHIDGLSENPHQTFVPQNSANGALDVSDARTSSQFNSSEIFNGSIDEIDLQNASSTLDVKNEKHKGTQDQRIECTYNKFDKKIEIESPAASCSHGVESLIVSPSKDDTVSQSQELDVFKDENQLCEEPQGLHDETEKWDISNDKDRSRDTYSSEITLGKDSYVYIDSGVVEDSMIVGTSEVDHNSDLTLSGFDSYLHSMSEKQDNNDSVVKVSEEPEALKADTTALDDGTTIKQNTNSLLGSPSDSPNDSGEAICLTEGKQLNAEKSWVEENFQEFDSVIAKIGVGFKENYMSAKEMVQQQPSLSTDITELSSVVGNDELEWMNDEKLQRIVFQVQDNELAGRDPFHSMNADDKLAFFKGLEDKAEKVNGKLLHLHEWVHSRIENIDYGADGISLNDPLKKIVPRWKGPPIDTDPEFLSHQKPIFTEEDITEKNLQETEDLSNPGSISRYASVNGIRKMSLDSSSIQPKTMIESSDGTIRPGKKKGKEHWEHTKKWSEGFLEVYNAERDPEIKSIMRDMGKDLDRWITEKETQDIADLMDTKIPKRKRRYIEKKLEKLKQEVQMFGAPAVVSKYREYTDEKEEDYLWWLDLPFVLCLELYTIEEGAPKVGFYSLEMAADLELNPKQYHVIAFEDPGDCKNFNYILQAHMDMLGSGKAFIVARPPKDAFREAKTNGFNVTVIRKGQIKLNVDQTLEEVEEEIAEIGSKIYHDKVMREQSVDANMLLKGVIAAEKITKTTKRKPKRTRRKTTKPAKP